MKDLEICPKCNEHHPRCSGHKKRKNSPDGKLHPCMKYPEKGFTGCKFHRSGRTIGLQNGNFKHGRYSKYAPKAIDERLKELQESRAEGELLTLRNEIELTEVRISQLTARLGSADSGKTWTDLKRARSDIRESIKSGNVEQMTNALDILDRIAKTGEHDYRSWDELFRVQKHYAFLIEKERKRMLEERFMLSLDEVSIILSMIGVAINEKVKDATIRRELANELIRISQNTGFNIA